MLMIMMIDDDDNAADCDDCMLENGIWIKDGG